MSSKREDVHRESNRSRSGLSSTISGDAAHFRRETDAASRDKTANRRDADAERRETGWRRRDEFAGHRDNDDDEQRNRAAQERDDSACLRDRDADQRDEDADEQDRATAAQDRAALGSRSGSPTVEHELSAYIRRTEAIRERGRRARSAAAAERRAAAADRAKAGDDRLASAASALDRRSAADFAALEERMAESEARASRLLQAIPDPVIVADADGIIELINARAVVLFGYEPGELIGQSVERLMPVGLHGLPRQHRATFVATNQTGPMMTGLDVVAVRKDGRTVPVEVNLSVMTLPTGRAVVACIRDISERKLSEAELRISDERFRLSFDRAPIGMALIDLRPGTVGRFLRVNQALRELTGYSEAELLATSSTAITHPDDRAETAEHLQRLVVGEMPGWDTEKRYLHANGDDVCVHFAVSVVQDARGAPSYGVSQVEDITHRKHVESQLAERFYELANNVGIGFVVRQIDPPAYLYYNPAFLTVYGLDPAGLAPTPTAAFALIHPDDAQRVATMLASAVHGQRAELSWRLNRPDGQLRWVSGHVSPIADGDGRIRRVVALFEDITERKAVEEDLLAARAEAERANTAKTDFVSRMSHELRTPLNAILGFGQLLEMDGLSAEQHSAVRQIVRAGDHLLGLIDEILDIAQVETGSIRLSTEPASVADVVRQTVDMLAPIADRRRVRIVVGELGGDAHVLADHQRLKQVMVNLLANAVKYNTVGGEVRIEGRPAAGGRYRLMVSDTGIGIAAADINRLFRPFERLAPERSDVEGTGLGLALTKRLITEMNGEVGVLSSLGEGSSFWVELPIAEAPSEGRFELSDANGKVSAPSPDGSQVAPRGAKTVLYIEDNLSNVRLLEQIVARRPEVTLLVAMQGQVGLDMALAHQPDLILLDLHLPDIPGEEVLQRLRADHRTADTEIVILSADATPDQPQRLIDRGATSYLTKPFNVPAILGMLDDLHAVSAARGPGDSLPMEPRTGGGTPRTADVDHVVEVVDATVDDDRVTTFVHDLINLLGVILTYCDLIAADGTRGSIDSRLEQQRIAAERAIELSRELLPARRR